MVLINCFQSSPSLILLLKYFIRICSFSTVVLCASKNCYNEREVHFICNQTFDIIRTYDIENKQTFGCAYVCPKMKTIIRFIQHPPDVYAYYRGMQMKFLDEIAQAKELKRGGIVAFFTDDKGSLSKQARLFLLNIGVIFLSHAEHIGVDFTGMGIFQPDYHFIESNGFKKIIELFFNRKKYLIKDKIPTLFWRGSTTGNKIDNNALTLPRVNICLQAKKIIHNLTNIKINRCHPWETEILESLDIYDKKRYPEETWQDYKAILDIDGQVNAWGLFWRLASGSVVYKVDGLYTNAYINQMQPWVHYIPITSNFSNLEQYTQLLISKKHEIFLQNITNNARKLVLQFTYEKEINRVTKELIYLWDKYPIKLPKHLLRPEIPLPGGLYSGDIITSKQQPSRKFLIRNKHKHEFIQNDTIHGILAMRNIDFKSTDIHIVSGKKFRAIPLGELISC